MKKIKQKAFDYPVVVRRVADDLVFSVPDLGYFKYMPLKLEKIVSDSAKSDTIALSSELLNEASLQLQKAWIYIDQHLESKKWLPNASTFKQSLQKAEEDYSLPEFVLKLNEFMSVSENTIRREIKRGQIQCYQTEGGHRRIPASEISQYLERRKTKKPDLDL